MSESATQHALLAAIGAVSFCLVERINTGVASDPHTGRTVRFGTPGAPDIRITLQSRAVAVEVKSERGRQSPEQVRWQAAFEMAGGVYLLCRNASDTVRSLADLATGRTRAELLEASRNLDGTRA